MTTLAATQPSAQFDDSRANTSLGHVIRSEWTKIWSVRSTMWTLIITVIVTVGFATLFAWGASSNLDTMPPQQRALLDPTNIAMAGLAFGQLAIAVTEVEGGQQFTDGEVAGSAKNNEVTRCHGGRGRHEIS